jgi:putative ABC transport system permease protein
MRRVRSIALHRPFVLIHFPPIFVAAAVASAILVCAAAAAPLFRSVTGTAAVAIGIGEAGDRVLMITKSGPFAADIVDFRDHEVRAATAHIADLSSPTEMLAGTPLTLTGRSGRTVQERIATRTEFAGHAQIVDGSARAAGLWLPRDLATALRVAVGDRVTATLGTRAATLPVGAIFTASRSDPFWAALFSIANGGRSRGFALIDRAGFLRIETTLEDAGQQTWSFALAPWALPRLTLDRAATLADAVARLDADASDPTLEVGTALGGPSVTSPVLEAVREAEAGQRTITPPTQTLAVAGELVAFFGILAAGAYGVRRRRVELRSLDAKGIAWQALWGRSASEATIPILAGGAVGWLCTWVGVRMFGPADTIDTSAIRSSAVAAAICVAGAVLVIATVMAVSARRQAREGVRGIPSSPRGSAWWEVPVLAVAMASLYEISTRGTVATSVRGSEIQVDRLLLLFPILFMAGGAGLAVRGLARALVRLRGSDSWPPPLFLASRRVSTAPRSALLLVTASALAIGVLAYAGIAVTTIRTSIRDKILVSSGADVTASTSGPIFPPPEGPSLRTTNVFHVPFIRAGSDGHTQVTLIGVEPDSFVGAASWEPSFSSNPLPDLMQRLGGAPVEPLPAILVGGDLAGQDRQLSLGGYHLPIDVVGTASAFPGNEGGLAVVVSAPALRAVLEAHDATVALNGADYRGWAHGDVGQARAFLIASGADPGSVVVAADRLQTPGYRALAWSFVFMELIGLMTAVVALIGLLLYLQARLRSRELSYALMRRMGLSASAHRVSVGIEIAGLLAAAYVIGTLLAIATALLVYRRLDPLPDLTPGPSLRAPGALFAGIAVAIAACSVAGAWFVQRRAERADVGAVLRFAD